MIPQLDHLAWTRSALVATAVVVAALIPVVAGGDEPSASPLVRHAAPQIKPTEQVALSGNRQTCLALKGKPVSVLEQRYTEIADDHNESGDTAVPMRGGTCWIKWSYGSNSDNRDGFASQVRFYRDNE